MAKGSCYTDEFKKNPVNQVVQQGYSVNDVAARLRGAGKTLYSWFSKFSKPHTKRKQDDVLQVEIACLKKQLIKIKQLWLKSGGLHGYRNLHLELKEDKVAD